MKGRSVIRMLALKLAEDFNEETWEAFMENTDSVVELETELDKIKCFLMNYDEYRQDYLNILIDEIDAIVKKKVKK